MTNIQVFEPDPPLLYSLEATARLARAPRHDILAYCKQGFISPVINAQGGYQFNDEAIRILHRIRPLIDACDFNLPGINIALDLMAKVEHLRADARFLRR